MGGDIYAVVTKVVRIEKKCGRENKLVGGGDERLKPKGRARSKLRWGSGYFLFLLSIILLSPRDV